MPTFIIDENLPRSLAPALEAHGYTAKDVREHGLRGRPDSEVYAFAQKEQATLISGDVGFSHITAFPLGTHHGIVVARLPNEMPAEQRNQEIIQALASLKNTPLGGVLVIITPGRVRVRRKQS